MMYSKPILFNQLSLKSFNTYLTQVLIKRRTFTCSFPLVLVNIEPNSKT